tara:strand:+ start:951 stop:1091 length:141 start_codon:yes stop_codon:yes gene_type:complete
MPYGKGTYGTKVGRPPKKKPVKAKNGIALVISIGKVKKKKKKKKIV